MLDCDSSLRERLEDLPGDGKISVWEAESPIVVIGRFGNEDRDIQGSACRADGVPVVRRVSGGGAVVLGAGCLSYSIVLPLDARRELLDVARSYELVLGTLIRALDVDGLTVEGTDIALEGRKVSGNAQRRGRRALLHHGTLLYDFDASLMERYLRIPSRAPTYRRSRSHADFVTNLPLDATTIRSRVVAAFPL